MSPTEAPNIFRLGNIPSLMWMTMKLTWSSKYRQEFYEQRTEIMIQWAYETSTVLDKFGHNDPALSAIFDEIMDLKDDPKYVNYSAENNTYVEVLEKQRKDAAQAYLNGNPEWLIERVDASVSALYGLSRLDHESVKDHTVWRQIWEVSVKLKQEALTREGVALIQYALSYEMRVEGSQIMVQAVKQVESEGLIDSIKLFPRGGTHDSVARDVEAFNRLLYAEWESGLKPMGEKEKRVEFREFLAHRQKTWGQEYRRWLKTR